MTRHSRNNCALPVFTYAEKAKLKNVYGVIETRVGRDSMKPFDSCSLCLQTCRDPMACSDGHIYCKECIFESILKQKREIEKDKREIELYNTSIETLESKEEREEKEKKVKEFVEMSSNVTKSTAPTTNVKKDTFWIPDLITPKVKPEIQIKKIAPQCYASKAPHAISLKKLTKVIFKETEDTKICPVCVKGFVLGTPIAVLKICGHALCRPCSALFIKKDGGKCPVCDVKCKTKELLQLTADGTGFSSKGQAVAKKESLPFQC